jgi:hypothetical protein
MTALAVGGLAVILTYHRRDKTSITAAAIMTVAATGLASGSAASGYVDLLVAALLVSALAAFVVLDDEVSSLVVGGAALAGAVMTKNEGLGFGIVTIAVALAATPHRRRRVAASGAMSLIPLGLWRWALAASDAQHEPMFGGDGPLHQTLSSTTWSRYGTGLGRIIEEIGFTSIVFVAVAVALRLCPRESLVAPIAFVGAGTGVALVAAGVYAFGPYDLEWWLDTSVARVASTSELALFAAAATILAPLLAVVHGQPVPHDGSD